MKVKFSPQQEHMKGRQSRLHMPCLISGPVLALPLPPVLPSHLAFLSQVDKNFWSFQLPSAQRRKYLIHRVPLKWWLQMQVCISVGGFHSKIKCQGQVATESKERLFCDIVLRVLSTGCRNTGAACRLWMACPCHGGPWGWFEVLKKDSSWFLHFWGLQFLPTY